jgi:hypothetical protein
MAKSPHSQSLFLHPFQLTGIPTQVKGEKVSEGDGHSEVAVQKSKDPPLEHSLSARPLFGESWKPNRTVA